MKRLSIIAALILFPLAFLSAQNFAARGYTVLQERSVEGVPTFDLQDQSGNQITVSMTGSLTERRYEALRSISDAAFSIPGLVVERLRVVYDGDRVDGVIVLASFTCEGTNLEQYLPSGLQFIFTDILEYDFRMKVENLFLRVTGTYLDAETFLERVMSAIDNPALYVQSQDPQFLFGRLNALNAQIEELSIEGRQLCDASEAADERLSRELESYAAEAMEMWEEAQRMLAEVEAALRSRIEALETVQAELVAGQETMCSNFDNLVEETGVLTEEFETMREGSVVLFTRSLFGAVKELDTETIDAIVALRKAEPDLPYADAASRVAEETGAEVDKKHALAVYAVYFNDYE